MNWKITIQSLKKSAVMREFGLQAKWTGAPERLKALKAIVQQIVKTAKDTDLVTISGSGSFDENGGQTGYISYNISQGAGT